LTPHLGYARVVIGVALLGLSILDIGVPASSAIHELTAGAIGTMALGVMSRVTLGDTGRDLTAKRAMVVVFVLIDAAAIVRDATPLNMGNAMPLLALSAGCWIVAFGLFEIVYGPMLLTRQLTRRGPP
jgi:uncharacterized protein involved in response to NO